MMSEWSPRILLFSLLVLSLLGSSSCGDGVVEEAPVRAGDVIDDPLWYRSLSDDAMILAAQKRLDLMTSTSVPANRAGPIKDEIALLCRSEAVVDLVVESFRRRKGISNAQMSAYMEIFSRIRHPRFAKLLADGLNEGRQEVQMNALEAAMVQRAPELVPYLLGAIKGKDGYVARKVLAAMIGIDSPKARRAVCEAVKHDDESVAVMALSAVGGMRLTDALPFVLTRAQDGPDQVRVMAGWAAARMGQSMGADNLIELALDRSVVSKARAQAIQNLTLLKWWEAAPRIKSLRDASVTEVALESHVFLACSRFEPELRWLGSALRGDDPLDRDIALRVCGRTGDRSDLKRVLDVQDHLTPRELIVFARSLLMGRPEGSLEFISGLIDTRPDLRVALLSLVPEFGGRGLRVLEDRLNRDSGEDKAWLLSLIGAIGSVRHPRAQDILKRFETSSDRLVWRFARENIRLIEQRMLKSALSAYRRPSGSAPVPK